VEELSPQIQRLMPQVANPRWLAIRLLDGDSRVQEALLSGELIELASAQRRADVQFSQKIALGGRQ
jgi:ferrous iron transport protein B